MLEVTEATTTPLGQSIQTTNRVMVLGQGMHFRDASGQWIESRPVIQAYTGGIICTGASYRVILNRNLNQSGSVDLEGPDGVRVISHPLALYFHDPESGQSVLLSQIQDCEAEVSPGNNEVIYRNAFASRNGSGIEAAVTYRYEAGKFSQDVTLTMKPSITPADLGLGSQTRLEIATEIYQGPVPVRTMHLWHTETNAVVRARMAEPDLWDETLSFGSELTMTLGRAFPAAVEGTRSRGPGLPVAKRLIETQGRKLLLESIEWESVKSQLEQLPNAPGNTSTTNRQAQLSREVPQMAMTSKGDTVPDTPVNQSFDARLRQVNQTTSTDTKMASAGSRGQSPVGFVMDYVMPVGGYYNGVTFYPAPSYTYHVQYDAWICTATFLPGAVVKYSPGASMYLTCGLDFLGSGAPIVLTAVDDNDNNGAVLGNGNPQGYYANWAFYCYYINNPITTRNLDIRYAANGFYCYLLNADIRCGVFRNCALGIYADALSSIALYGVTMQNVDRYWDYNYEEGGYVYDWGWDSVMPVALPREVMTGKGHPVQLGLQGTGCGTLSFSDVPGDGLPTHHLTFSVSSEGSVSYTPNSTFTGEDDFYFIASDGIHNSAPGLVRICVTPCPVLQAECRPRSIVLSWNVQAVSQLFGDDFVNVGFNVYRSTTSGGQYTKLTETPIPYLFPYPDPVEYWDTSVVPNTSYYYAVTLVRQVNDSQGHQNYESPKDNQVGPISTCCNPSGGFWVDKGPTAQQMAEWIMGAAFTVSNAKFTGLLDAKGSFANGNSVGLNGHVFPIDRGVILASGDIVNALGPNDLSSAESRFERIGIYNGDPDLDSLVGGSGSKDAAVLEFDVSSSTSVQLQIQYIFASEEYPEYAGSQFNDVFAIFVTSNREGGNWNITPSDNIALVPQTMLAVAVNNVSGGCTPSPNYLSRNEDYYVDNDDPDPNYSAQPPKAAPTPVFNLQYDGFSTLLTGQKYISANVTYHVKIAISDYNDDQRDSAVEMDPEI